uniref:Cell division protein ZapB n=1 Tax=Strongyloides venezuelensis TaxID=75913 RepID=A0A0K0FWE5_STRVS
MKKGTFSYSPIHFENKLPIEDQEEHSLSQSYFKLKENLENYEKKLNAKNKDTLISSEKNLNFHEDTLNRANTKIEKFNQILNELKKMGIHL